MLPSTSAVGLTTEASAAWPNALGKLTRDLESVLGSKVVGLVRERTSKAVSAGLWWWLFGENGEPVDVELTVQMIRRYWGAERFAVPTGRWTPTLAKRRCQ